LRRRYPEAFHDYALRLQAVAATIGPSVQNLQRELGAVAKAVQIAGVPEIPHPCRSRRAASADRGGGTGVNYELGSRPETRCPSFGLTLQEAYRLLRGAPAASQVVRTAVLGTTTWLVMEAAATARDGLPEQRDAALQDIEAILDACGMADPMLRPILDTARAVAPERTAQEGEAEKRDTSIAWLLRQLRAHCVSGVGIERGDAEMMRVAADLGMGLSACPWVPPSASEGRP
jgi:hypothetical protein